MHLRSTARLGVLLALVGCSRSFPPPPAPPPPPPPPSLVGRVVTAVPGTSLRPPAAGAYVQLTRSNLAAQANADGRFSLGPLPARVGQVLIQLDRDGDGRPDLQRLLDLATLDAAGHGDINAGEIVLGESAAVSGHARRTDLPDPAHGQAGTTVAVPGTDLATRTGEDGAFLLAELPAGPLSLVAFAPGYAPAGLDGLGLQPGQLLALRDLPLSPAPAGVASLSGRLHRGDQADSAGVTVTLAGDGDGGLAPLTTGADGQFRFDAVPAGLYALSARAAGLAPLHLPNLLLPQGGAVDLGTLELAAGQAEVPAWLPADAGAAPGNRPPVAACADLQVESGQRAQLDGSGSSDPDGDRLRYQWDQSAGPAVSLDLNGSTLADRPSFVAPTPGGRLAFHLTVTDPAGASASASCQVVVDARPVAALAAPFAVVAPGSLVTADGSASRDADPGDALSYQFTAQDPADGGAPALQVSGAQARLTMPSTPGERVRVTLVVSDGQLSSAPAVEDFYVAGVNLPPVVDAGPTERDLDWGATVLLSPGAYDPDGTISSLSWSQSCCSSCLAQGPTQPDGTVTFTAQGSDCDQVVHLVATDNQGAQTSVALRVHVRDTQPVAVVDAGPLSTALGPAWFAFARPVDPASLDGGALAQQGGAAASGTWRWSDSQLLTFSPAGAVEPGQTLRLSLTGLRNTHGLGLADGGYELDVAGRAPALAGPSLPVHDGLSPQGDLGPIASGPEGLWTVIPDCFDCGFGGGGHLDLNYPGGSVGADGHDNSNSLRFGTPRAQRTLVDELAQHAAGSAWFSRHDPNDDPCGNGGAVQLLHRATALPSRTVMFDLTPPPGLAPADAGVYPGTDCAVTRFAAAGVDRGQAAVVGAIEWQDPDGGPPADGGPLAYAVRLYRCVDCMSAVDPYVDARPPVDAWAELPRPVAPVTEPLSELSLASGDQPLAVAWVAQTAQGARLRAARFDPASQTWTALTGPAGAELNPAGDAAHPVLRWAGPDLVLAYAAPAGPALEVLRFPGGLGPPVSLGGPPVASALLPQRPELVAAQGTLWLGWSEPSAGATDQPRLAYYDLATGAWASPAGVGATGELPLLSGCGAFRPSLTPRGDGAGVVAAFFQACPSGVTDPTANAVVTYEAH